MNTNLEACQRAMSILHHVPSRIWGGQSSMLPTSHCVYLALGQMSRAVQWHDCCEHAVSVWQQCGKMAGLHSHEVPDESPETWPENNQIVT